MRIPAPPCPDGFLVSVGPLEIGPALPTSCIVARYDYTRFHASLFERHGVAFPSAIRASTVRRQAEYLAGRLCARQALARHGWRDYPVLSGISREPLWPAGILGSISHGAGYALAVVGARRCADGLGIDVESVARGDTSEAIGSMVVSPAEMDYLLGMRINPEKMEWLLTLVFSAKESFFKASFGTVGRYFGFDMVRVTAIDMAARTLILTTNEALCSQIVAGEQYQVQYRDLDTHTLATACVLRHANVRMPCA
jgi:enterobactin synthetase component D